MALFQDEAFEKPIMIDVFRVSSNAENQYDLPLWFQGHLLETNFDFQTENTLQPMGENHGYQHLWKEAEGKSIDGNEQISWFNKGQFYTMTSAVDTTDVLIFGRSGANDPSFNLRRDPCFIIRKTGQKDAVFLSIIEPHGDYNPVDEIPNHPYGELAFAKIVFNSDNYTAVSWRTKEGQSRTLIISNQDNNENTNHTLTIDGKDHQWKGGFSLIEN